MRFIDGHPVSYYPASVPVQIDLFTNGRQEETEPGFAPIVENTAEEDLLSFSSFLNSPYATQWCDRENISIVIDEQGAVAMGLIFEHENHENPHPQYNRGLLDAQKKIDDLTRLLDELKDRVEATEDQIEGIEGNSVNGGNFKFFVRHFTQANTIYPLLYRANGRPNGQGVSYHMNKVSVEQLPNDSVVMTLDFTTYWIDSYHALYLPYSLEEPEIMSIIGTPYSDVDVNDVTCRVIRYGTDVINGKKYSFIVLMADRVSGTRDSPFNGWSRMYATIRGRRKYQDVANLDVYPVSNILAP